MKQLAIHGGRATRGKPFPQWPLFDDAERKALNEVLDSGVWGIGGSKVAEFEKQFAESHGCQHGIAVVNGTVALGLALLSAGVGPEDEVIVPSYTFMATASAVLFARAVPVFVDIDPDTYCMDPRALEAAITRKTKAIIPVHLGGHLADMDEIMRIARQHSLLVIEDACQAHYAEWNGRKAGSIGHMGCFSFQSSKNICSGEGGIVITNDATLADLCWSFHNCGRITGGAWYEHPRMGWNMRLSQFQAAILLTQMQRAEAHLRKREENAHYLTERLSRIDGIEALRRDARVSRHSYHLFIMKYDPAAFAGIRKEHFIAAMHAEGIPLARGYVPIHKEGYLTHARKLGYRLGNVDFQLLTCPVAEKACDEEALWLTQNVLLGTMEDMDSIIAAFRKVKENIGELVEP